MTTMKFRVWSYDVWGNRKDGYEVNNRYRTPHVIDVPEGASDFELTAALKKVGYLNDHLHYRSVDYEGERDYTLYFSSTTTRHAGYPLGELERLREEDE